MQGKQITLLGGMVVGVSTSNPMGAGRSWPSYKTNQTKILGVVLSQVWTETIWDTECKQRNLENSKLYDGYVVFNCDLPAWGAVETSAAQHWDNDKKNKLKIQQRTSHFSEQLHVPVSITTADLHHVMLRYSVNWILITCEAVKEFWSFL